MAPGFAKTCSGAPRVRAEPPERRHGRPDRGGLVGKQVDDVGEHAVKVGRRVHGGARRTPVTRTDGIGQKAGGAGGGGPCAPPSAGAAPRLSPCAGSGSRKVPAEGAVFLRGMCCLGWWAGAAAASARRGGSRTGTGMGAMGGRARAKRVHKEQPSTPEYRTMRRWRSLLPPRPWARAPRA